MRTDIETGFSHTLEEKKDSNLLVDVTVEYVEDSVKEPKYSNPSIFKSNKYYLLGLLEEMSYHFTCIEEISKKIEIVKNCIIK